MNETEEEINGEYSTLTEAQLREMCNERGLEVSGCEKQEIVDRLIDSDNDFGIYDDDDGDSENNVVGAEANEDVAASIAAPVDDPVVVNDSTGDGDEIAAGDNNDGGDDNYDDLSPPTAHDNNSNESAATTTTALPSTTALSRSGIAEDAELLAELKAISNKSSSGRFQEEDYDDTNNNNDVVEEAERLDENCSSNNDNDIGVNDTVNLSTNDHDDVVTDADENGWEEFDNEDEFDDDAFLPNAATETDAGEDDAVDNENDSGVAVEENVAHDQHQSDEGVDMPLEVTEEQKQKIMSSTEDDTALLAEMKNISSSCTSRFENDNDHDVVADKEEEEDNESVYHDADDDMIQQQQEVIDPPTEQNLGIKSSLPNTFNGKNGGAAEDADLLAELRAISNKASGGRFDDGEDGNNNDTEIAPVVVEGADNEAVSNNEAASTPPVEESAKPLPPWKQKKKSKKKTSSTAFDVDIVVASAPAAPAPVDPFENAFCDEKNDEPASNSAPDHPVAEDVSGIKSSLPNTFNGKNGGAAEDADLLAELRAISNKASGGRFDDGEDYNNNDVVDGAVNEAVTTEEAASTPPVEESAKPLPPWKQKKKSKKKTSSTAFDVDIVVASAPAAPAPVDPFENALCDEKNDEPASNSAPVHPVADDVSGIKSSLPNTFNGKNGGAAEDADLLAELRAISNKASGGRFDDGEDGNGDDTEIAPVVVDGAVNEAVTDNEAASTPPVEESAKPLPPWKQKKKSKKKTSSTAFDVDIVVASAPAAPAPVDPFENAMCDEKSDEPASNSAPDHPVAEDVSGIKSSLPNTFNGRNGGAAEDADLLAELRAISNKASGGRFDDGDESSSKEVTENPNDASVEDKKSNAQASPEPLPPWKQQHAAKKKQPPNSFDVDIVVAAAPTPAAVVEETSIEPDTAQEQQPDISPPTENNFGIKSSLPNTFNGKNGGAAEDADLLAELRAISNKTSGSRFDGEEDDDNDQPASKEVKSDEVAVVKENAALPSAEEETLKPWKRKNAVAKTKTSPSLDVDVVVAAAPVPAVVDPFQNAFAQAEISEPACGENPQRPAEANTGIKTSLPNTFNGKNGGVAEDADLLAELRAISNKASGSRFVGEEVDDNAQSTINEDVSIEKAAPLKDTFNETAPPPASAKKSDTRNASRPLPPWKRKGAATKNKTSPTEFNVDVVVAAPHAPEANDKSQKPASCDQVDESAEPSTEVMMGIKSSLPNTFNGKNGGTAEDADLLAELRAISNKTSVNRFDVEDDGNNAESSSNREDCTAATGAATLQSNEKKSDVHHSSKATPPWKQKRTAVKKTDFNVDLVVADPPAPVVVDTFESASGDESFVTAADEKDISTSNDTDEDIVQREATELPAMENVGIKSSLPNTFNGKNGGIAEDADLLAELRAISNKTSGSRFEGGGEDDNFPTSTSATPPAQKNEKIVGEKAVPPWKQKNSARKDSSADAFEVDIVVAAPVPVTIGSSGNDAANEKFRDDGNENVENSSKSKTISNDDKPWKKKNKDRASGSLPPWKVKREKNSVDKSHSESVPDPFQNALIEDANPNSTQSSCGPSHVVEHATQSTTFNGKNGGAAEDADLLAELQAISSKSSTRFVDSDDPMSESPRDADTSTSSPPWKRKVPLKKAKNVEIDVVVSAPPNDEPKEENMGIKSSLPTTFNGKNGGTAEDADLLAELRAISMKNSSSRFSDGDGDKDEVGSNANDAPAKPNLSLDKPWQKNKPSKNDDSRPLPPWKQKGAKKNAFAVGEMDITVGAPPVQSINETACNSDSEPKEEVMGIKSQFTNTFKGDRGGSAEDADLLAELRAISKNSSSNRFADAADLGDPQIQKSQGSIQEVAPKSAVTLSSPKVQKTLPKSDIGDLSAMNPFPTASAPPAAEINITLDGLDESLASSNWHIRKASYQFLQEKIEAVLSGSEPLNQLSGDDVYSSLDDAIAKALGDKNAGALDSALTLSVTYSDCCKGACSEDTASRIMLLLLKGAAFASPRPSTLKTTQELVFKLVEVAPEGSSTADNVVDLIQQHGLKAKKPKVVKFAATLVLQLIQEFGTSGFNVSKLSAVHETLVGNSNDKIRAVGIEVLAELCRTFASKTPLQALVDKLKKSQQSQLDSLLDKQPTATPPSRRLRCMRGVQIVSQSPEEALAALKKKEEEEKLKRFATRPAVNLLQVLPQTCYADKIKEVKWSEKVAALNALIEAGGEQPYKILNGNYTTLLRELKQLLGHTHYLVCSKALAAIGMLAEGVGEPISSDLKPLLPTIVPLFKDKKVGKAVMSCLDQMFGNALRFDHFLGSNDSFLSSLDEKKEKNALVRKSVLEFLSRCVVSSGSYGTCGTLTGQHAQDLSKISCDKLKDSDASTRKAATDVLVSLLNSKDEVIVSTAEKVTSTLQSSNPRAFKTLSLATKSGKPDASKNGVSRPGTAPLKAASSQSNKSGRTKARPATAPKSKTANVPSAPAKNIPSSGADEGTLPSLEESIDSLSALGIPQWGDDADNGGVLAGIQSSNWKQRMVALNNLATYYESNGDRQFSSIASLFVLVKACTKSFQESNFNVSKAILELFKALFNIYADRHAAPEAFLYAPIVKLAAEKIGDRKLSSSSSSCLDSICIVKDPQRVLQVATKAVDGVKSPLVHEALLVWIKSFSVNFGLTALSQGVKDVLVWILKECESNNMKVKNAARDVLGEMYTQLGPVLESFVKSSDVVSSSVSSMVEKVFKDSTYDPNANQVERKLKCIAMSSSNDPSGGSGKKGNASSMLALPTTDLMSALKSDCLDRMNDTGDKKSWRNRKEALDEVNAALGKCGGLLSTEGKAFSQLKQLAENLRLRINDSQSNLKPLAASVIGSLLSHLDDTAQARLGSVVFPALVNAAMNDMKKTMRDAAVSSLELGTERPKQNGGGTNAPSVEAFILSLESELSDASIKSSGLPDVLAFLTAKMETLIATTEQEKLSVHRSLAKVIVRSLLSSKSGSRSAAESLLTVCSKNSFVPSASFDKEIGRLLPAQQRTVRSFIPKMSKQDQELVDTFKKASERPRRPGQMMSSRQATQVVGANKKTTMQSTRGGGLPRKSNNVVETNVLPENPLQMMNNARSLKQKGQRLAMLGKGDSWPEYSEEPSSDTIQALRKSWSSFIPSSSIDVLLPQSGLRTHEDCISGCDLLSKAIGYSRDNNDSSFLELLDFIFKWATCAVSLRNHTSGFRKLLSTILDLFERLDELSYVISDAEALLLLPYLVDKASVAKLQFKEEILTIFTLVTTKKVYPSQKFGSVCIKVLEKSKSNPSRSLAAELCSVAVQSTGVSAIGRKGLVILSNALNEETVAEAKKVYIDLFEIVVEKLKGDTDKLFSAINPTDKVKALIMECCAKQPVATHGSPKRSPPRKIAPPVSHYSPTNDQEAPALSSSAVVTGNLRARLQKSKEAKMPEESHRLPPLIDTSSAASSPSCHTPRTTSTDTEYNGIMTDINWMTQIEGCKSTDIVRGTDAIQLLRSLISNNENSSIDHIKRDAFREKIESDYNTCMQTVASALEFAFEHGGKNAQLPSALINETVSALSHLIRMECCRSETSQETVEKLVKITVSALLDERIHINHDVVKATNKVAMRAVVTPSLDNSLNALISVQVSILDPMEGSVPSEKFRLKFSRVLEKLLKRIIKDRNDSSLANPFGELKELGPLLASIDWIIETIEEISRMGSVPEELLAPSKSMTKYLLLELVKCKKGKVRETVVDLGDDVKFIESLLRECEQELGIQQPPPEAVSEDSTFRERLEALKRQRESSGK